jgi:methylase of polypeptide subunit release factors
MKKCGYDELNIKSILDVGCGTGVLGAYLVAKNSKIEFVGFSDSEPPSVELTKYNLGRIAEQQSRSLELHPISCRGLDDSMLRPDGSRYDLLLCSPPYIPMFSRVMPISSPVESTGLLREVVTEFPDYADELILGISSIAWIDFERALEDSKNIHSRSLEYTILNGDGFWVPLRIPHLSSEHLEELVQERGLQIGNPVGEDRGFKYWQKLLIVSVKLKNEG